MDRLGDMVGMDPTSDMVGMDPTSDMADTDLISDTEDMDPISDTEDTMVSGARATAVDIILHIPVITAAAMDSPSCRADHFARAALQYPVVHLPEAPEEGEVSPAAEHVFPEGDALHRAVRMLALRTG